MSEGDIDLKLKYSKKRIEDIVYGCMFKYSDYNLSKVVKRANAKDDLYNRSKTISLVKPLQPTELPKLIKKIIEMKKN
jgi:hypothetical protein